MMLTVPTWVLSVGPLWALATWLAAAAFAGYIAMEKDRCTLCWFAWGVLFGPLALLAVIGLPMRVQPVVLVPRAAAEAGGAAAHADTHAGHASTHAAHAPSAPVHRAPPPATPSHGSAPSPLVAKALAEPAHPPATAPAAEPIHADEAPAGKFNDKQSRGVLVVGIALLLLLIYFGSSHF